MLTQSHTKTFPTALALSTLFIIAACSIIFSLCIGSVHLGIHTLEQTFFTSKATIAHKIVFDLRLPRALCAFVTGGLLALAGALMQTLLRNPLADPYVLGISGGGAVATLIAMLLGISLGTYLNIWTFIGSFLSIILVIGLTRIRGQWSSLRLLLTGVVIATGWGALISFILTVSPQQDLRDMLFWLMGDLSYAHFSIWQPIILIAGLGISLIFARSLNILTRGDIAARSLGVNVARLNLFLYLTTSLLTACAVSIAGCIGFIGLIVPHMLRLIGKADHRFILPGSVLLGGILLTIADALARSILAPIQLPVGIVTAIIGVPSFLFLLHYGCKS